MPERKVKVGSSVGLHARPATIFTQAAAKQPVKVTIAKAGGNPVDARSVLFVLGLSLVASVLFGLAPALQAANSSNSATLRTGAGFGSWWCFTNGRHAPQGKGRGRPCRNRRPCPPT